MNENLVSNLEKELENSLKKLCEGVPAQIGGISKFLNQEYEKEIKDQISFLKSITVMAGTVAPFSLTLLSVQSLNANKPYLLIGFVLLLITVLVALLSSKKFAIDGKYKDTSNLAFNHIIARCAADNLMDTTRPLLERATASADVLKNVDEINSNFSELGYTNKLAVLKMSLSQSNQWSVSVFSLGIVFIIMAVIYSYLVDLLTYFIIMFR